MNPLVVVRGLAGLALPVALGAAYYKRRRGDGAEAEGHPVAGNGEVDPGSSRSHRRMSAETLRAFLAEGRDLTRVDLKYADLSHLDLSGRDLANVDLSHAHLAGCVLSGADLLGATLDHADLGRCDLRNADLTAASVFGTSFWRADLRGADLRLCLNILMANFRGARFDAHTRWPKNFDPQAAGARQQRR